MSFVMQLNTCAASENGQPISLEPDTGWHTRHICVSCLNAINISTAISFASSSAIDQTYPSRTESCGTLYTPPHASLNKLSSPLDWTKLSCRCRICALECHVSAVYPESSSIGLERNTQTMVIVLGIRASLISCTGAQGLAPPICREVRYPFCLCHSSCSPAADTGCVKRVLEGWRLRKL